MSKEMTDQTLSTQEHPMSIAERAADNIRALAISMVCLLYTSDAADE